MSRLMLMVALVGWPVVSIAQEIDRRVAADPAGRLEISNPAGDIVVEGWQQNEVHVTGDLGGNVERLDVFSEGARVIVRVVLERDAADGRFGGGWRGGTDLRIRAPEGMSLEIDTVGADVEVRGLRGEQRIAGVSGDVETEAYEAEIQVETVSGDIRVSGRAGDLVARAAAVSGDVRLTGLSGEVRAEAVSGDVMLRGGTISRAEVRTVSGDILVLSELSADARLEATATSGDIELQFLGPAGGDYRLETFSGVIDNCFGPRASEAERIGRPGRQLRFREGDAAARVEARTHSGDIDVCRE